MIVKIVKNISRTFSGVVVTWLSNFTFTFHFHALEKEMATHSSILAWRIPGTEEPSGLPSMGSHRVRHDWSDLAAAEETARYQEASILLSNYFECNHQVCKTYATGFLLYPFRNWNPGLLSVVTPWEAMIWWEITDCRLLSLLKQLSPINL